MSVEFEYLSNVHKHSFKNKHEIQESTACGCFHCMKLFNPGQITDWIEEISDNMQTARCPFCGIDSVIGDKSGYSPTTDLLKSMHKIFF